MGTTYFRNKNVHIKENFLERFQFMDEKLWETSKLCIIGRLHS